MAKEECLSQWSKGRDTSTVRNRKAFPSPEQTYQSPITPVSKNKQGDGNPFSNGSSSDLSARSSVDSPGKLLLIVLTGLSFATRLYKITEPPHVWWVTLLPSSMFTRHFGIFQYWLLCVSAGMKLTLGRWEATTSTEPSFLMCTLLLEKWAGFLSKTPRSL